MRQMMLLAACAVALASCNKGPEVSVKNASVNDVARAVSTSGVMNSDTMVQPGLWESKVTIQQMDIPGMPPQYADRMKQAMAEHRTDSSKHCITEADVKKPKADFFGADKSCKYDHFTMGGGKIDIAMVCREEESTQTSKMSGTYTPTSYSMDVSSSASGGNQNGMQMKMHVDSQRVGECTGKDDG